jgi:hypothetical protein
MRTVLALRDRCHCRVLSAGEQYYTAHSESFCLAEELPPSYSITVGGTISWMDRTYRATLWTASKGDGHKKSKPRYMRGSRQSQATAALLIKGCLLFIVAGGQS